MPWACLQWEEWIHVAQPWHFTAVWVIGRTRKGPDHLGCRAFFLLWVFISTKSAGLKLWQSAVASSGNASFTGASKPLAAWFKAIQKVSIVSSIWCASISLTVNGAEYGNLIGLPIIISCGEKPVFRLEVDLVVIKAIGGASGHSVLSLFTEISLKLAQSVHNFLPVYSLATHSASPPPLLTVGDKGNGNAAWFAKPYTIILPLQP